MKYGVYSYMLKPLDYREFKKTLFDAKAVCESRRKYKRVDITEEAREMFFVDLFCGSIHSSEELQKRMSELDLPFGLERSKGYLIKISLSGDVCAGKYEADPLEFVFKNLLSFSIPGTGFYFMRKSHYEYYYVAVGEPLPEEEAQKLVRKNAEEMEFFDFSMECYHPFASLESFLQAKKVLENANPAGQSSNEFLIRKAIEYMEQNYDKNLSRDSVAEKIYLSPSHFSYLFKQKTGIGFLEYLTNIRMKKAMELLGTRLRVNEIAERVGYQNRNRFVINFRQYTGYMPTEYRTFVLALTEEVKDDAD